MGLLRYLGRRDSRSAAAGPSPRAVEIRELRERDEEILAHLRHHGGNVSLAAAELDVPLKRVERLKAAAGIPTERVMVRYGDRTSTREAVRASLVRNGGNVKRAVRETGVPESTIRHWRDEWGIAPFRA